MNGPPRSSDILPADAWQRRWLDLRQQLWPHCTADEHLTEMEQFVADPGRFAQFLAFGAPGEAIGLVEISLRHDHVNGTQTSPVAFLEGIYVVPHARRSGVARRLVAAAEQWALDRGCAEFASDARLENIASHAMHAALGFVETERVVYFRKVLT